MTTTKASSTTAVTATSSKRLSGLMSGLDTDTLVKQLTSGTQSKIDKQLQNKQIAAWRQASYREVTKALNEFKSKYFSSATSSSSILSSSFFNSTSIKNSSPFLNISGSTVNAKSMMITGISKLAKQASLYSQHAVTNGNLVTGKIQEVQTPASLAGASVTINYNGKDYDVALDSDFMFNADDVTSDEQVHAIVDSLNYGISKIDGLKGNVSFSTTDGTSVSLNKTFGAAGSVTLKDGTENLLKGLGLNGRKGATGDAILGEAINSNYFFKNQITAGSNLEFTIGTDTYKLNFASSVGLPIDGTPELKNAELTRVLTATISANADLKDKITASVGTDGAVSFALKDGVSGTLDITGGSENMLKGLGLTADGSGYTTTGTLNQSELIKTHLQDTLAGSTLTFSLNGLTRDITFKESEKSQYATVDGLNNYLNTQLTTAFGVSDPGVSKVQVSTTNGTLSFSVTGLTTDTDILSISSCDKSGVLGMSGALHTYAGETNRLNLKKTLMDLSATPPVGYPNLPIKPTNLATNLSGDTSYTMNVNGKEFTFKNTDSINSILTTINNDAQANVTISYSSTTNTFSAIAKSGGANSKAEITDVSGNLAKVMFGDANAASGYTVTPGQDAELSVTFDGNVDHATTIKRSENSFELDGVNFELLKETDSTVNSGSPIKFSIENKTDDLYKKINDFVTDYNNIIKLANGKVSEKKPTDGVYLPLTDDQKKEMSESQITSWENNAKKGILQGDTLLNTLSLNLRHSMTDQVTSISSALYQFGIATKDYADNGVLTVDETKLKAALTSDPDKIATLFTGTDGIATKMQDVITANINPSVVDTGILVQKAGSDSSTSKIDNSTLADNIRDYDSQIQTLKKRLESEQERYYNKFTQLETYLSKMNSQASWFGSNTSES